MKYYINYLDNELYYKSRKEGVRKKVVLIPCIEKINDTPKHHHSEAMGGCSGFNATLQKISMLLEWNETEDVQECVS